MIAAIRHLLREDSRRNGGTDGKLIGGLGRYENLTPFEVWLCENVNEIADDSSGSTEWSEWFARAGKRLIEVTTQGFWYVSRFATEAEAVERYEFLDAAYVEWETDLEDPEV